MNEESVRDTLKQAGIPCVVTEYYSDAGDGEVRLTGTPFHIQVGWDYLAICKNTQRDYKVAAFTNVDNLVEQVRIVLNAYRKLN